MNNQPKVLSIEDIQKGQSLILTYYTVEGKSFEQMHPFTMKEFCEIVVSELKKEGCQDYSLNVSEYSSKDAVIDRGHRTEEVTFDVLFDTFTSEEIDAIKPALVKFIQSQNKN